MRNVEDISKIDRQSVADKRAQAASLEMQARRLHREADEIERLLVMATVGGSSPAHSFLTHRGG